MGVRGGGTRSTVLADTIRCREADSWVCRAFLVDGHGDGERGGVDEGDSSNASGSVGINHIGSADDETLRTRLRPEGLPIRSPSSARHTIVSIRVVSDVARSAM